MSARALEAQFSLSVGAGPRRFDLQVELHVERGVLVLFGPSGSGKSLTLQALAGIVRPTSGRIVVGGRPLFDAEAGVDVPAHQRRLGYVPQAPSLFPFRDVLGNVLFGLPRGDRRRGLERVADLMSALSITHLSGSRPEDLSGGELQRVALARALAVEPDLLLLDEPFAAVDVEGRRDLRATLRAALDRHETSAVFVTHDPEEAGGLGDSVVNFERGRTLGARRPREFLAARRPAENDDV